MLGRSPAGARGVEFPRGCEDIGATRGDTDGNIADQGDTEQFREVRDRSPLGKGDPLDIGEEKAALLHGLLLLHR